MLGVGIGILIALIISIFVIQNILDKNIENEFAYTEPEAYNANYVAIIYSNNKKDSVFFYYEEEAINYYNDKIRKIKEHKFTLIELDGRTKIVNYTQENKPKLPPYKIIIGNENLRRTSFYETIHTFHKRIYKNINNPGNFSADVYSNKKLIEELNFNIVEKNNQKFHTKIKIQGAVWEVIFFSDEADGIKYLKRIEKEAKKVNLPNRIIELFDAKNKKVWPDNPYEKPYNDEIKLNSGFQVKQKEKNGKWAYFNDKDEQITDFEYKKPKDGFKDFHEGFAAVNDSASWGYINKQGEEIVKCQYHEAQDFSNGYAWVAIEYKTYYHPKFEQDKKYLFWGCLNKNLILVISADKDLTEPNPFNKDIEAEARQVETENGKVTGNKDCIVTKGYFDN